MDMPRTEDGKLDVKALVAEHERWFEHGGRRIPYMFFPCQGNPERKRLLISFGAWGGGYNRVRGYYETLRSTHDLLFLQDNHNPEKKGVWYLAEKGDFSIEEAYTALIAETVARSGVAKEDVWLLGSSMGGFAALFFAYKLDLGRVVAICPVIAIHNLYGNWDKMRMVCDYVVGDSGVDIDAHIFKNFDRTVSTEAHIAFNKDDRNMIESHVGRLLELMVRNRNKFTVQTYDIAGRPDNVTPHGSALAILDRQGILALFNRSLVMDYVVHPE
jgi:hypothetical protein